MSTHDSLLYIEAISERQSQTLNPMLDIRLSLWALDISDHPFLLQEFLASFKYSKKAISVHQAKVADLSLRQARNKAGTEERDVGNLLCMLLIARKE